MVEWQKLINTVNPMIIKSDIIIIDGENQYCTGIVFCNTCHTD